MPKVKDDPQFGDAAGKPPSWFARVPSKAIIDDQLTHAQVRILAVICTYGNNQGFAWPNLKTIQKKANVNPKTLDRAMRALKKQGYIEVISRHRSHPKWKRIMGCVYRIKFDDGLETDKLIDQMTNEDAKSASGGPQIDEAAVIGSQGPDGTTSLSEHPRASDALSDDSQIDIPDEGDSNQNERLDVDLLVHATNLAQQYSKEAEQSHGQLRLVNPRAVEAAKMLIGRGWSDNEVVLEYRKELKRRREAGRDAPHHLGDCLGVR